MSDQGNEDWSVPFDTACVHAPRGQKDEAFRWLDEAVETRLDDLVRRMRHRAGPTLRRPFHLAILQREGPPS